MTELALGIDIGGTNTVFGLINRNGQCIQKSSVRTTDYPDPQLLVDVLKDKVNSMLSKLKDTQLKGVGIGAPNGNYYNGTIEFAPNLEWKGIINLVDLFKPYFKAPVFVTNDANAAAIGEMTYGHAQDCNDFILVTLGTGLGTGIVSRGHLIYGHDGFAGELGHAIVEPNGRLCACGRKGCLETYASATGIVKTAILELKTYPDDSILKAYKPELITAKNISNAAQEGDKLALQVFDYTAQILGLALANAATVTSPKKIILFGGLANSGELLLNPLKRYLEDNLLKIFKNKIDIIQSGLDEGNAAILGASALVWNELKSQNT